jgi:hypothetical protein
MQKPYTKTLNALLRMQWMSALRALEIKAETDTVKQAVKHGWKTRKLMFIGVRGAPDRLFGKEGRSVLIEFKRQDEVPTLQQMRRHEELRRQFGWEVYWTDSYAEACTILGIPE